MKKLYLFLLITLLLPYLSFGKSYAVEKNDSEDPTADTPFITTWDLSKTGSTVYGGTTSLTFGVAVAGAVNYTWRATDNSTNGSGAIPAGTPNATITGLPAGKTIVLSIEPANFRRININNGTNRQRLTDVKQWGTTAWSSMERAFYGCNNLNITAMDVPNLGGVTSMFGMFEGCTILDGPANIGSWDVSKVTNMSYMFNGALVFNQDIGNWKVGNVTTMLAMFQNASKFHQPIGSWDVSNVTNMSFMFNFANAFNQPIGSWDVSKVTNMSYMFNRAYAFNQNIESWNVGNVTTMQSMFSYASAFNQNIGNWNVGNVTNMSSMFYYVFAFNQNIGSWDVSKVTDMQSMFSYASAFNQNIGAWTLNSGVNLGSMLSSSRLDCANYSATLMGWAANPATPTGRNLGANGRTFGTNAVAARTMLMNPTGSGGKGWTITGDSAGVTACTSLAAEDYFITTWDLSKTGSPVSGGTTSLSFGVEVAGAVNYTWRATDNSATGSGTINNGTTNATITGLPAGKTIELSIEPANFRRITINYGTDRQRLTDVKQWGTTAWSSMQNAFYGCSNLNITATDAPNLGGVTSMFGMFEGCTILDGPPNIGSWDVSKVTNMSFMFNRASAFNQNIGSWDVSKVTNMSFMFNGALVFNQDIGNWKVGNVTTMSAMFQNAYKFDQPIGSWDVSKVTNMSFMFNGALVFNQDIGSWDVGNVTNMSQMFTSANSFNQPIGSWDVSKVMTMESMFYSASAFNQNIGSWNAGNVTTMYQMFWSASKFNQPIGSWDVSKVTDMRSMFYGASAFNQNIGTWTLNSNVNLSYMLDNSGLNCSNYSSTLIGWAANPATPTGRNLGATGRTYGTNAVAARTMLMNPTGSGGNGWNITGDTAGAGACGTTPDANNILYVNTAVVGGDGSGNSWANAIKELADALKWANTNKANFTTTPLQIWVAKGTYKPMYRPDTFAGPNITDRNNSFLMVNNVKLYGGFAGTETTLAERNLGITANATILSGDYNNDDVVTGTGATLAITGNGENAGHVVVSADAVGVAELNGFTIEGGSNHSNNLTVNNLSVGGYGGGGIILNTSSPTIQNCVFKENTAINVGGAMSLNSSSPKVINSLFVNNLVTFSNWGGGAISNSGSTSQAVFISCTIAGNRGANGGAMYNSYFPQSKIYNTIIYGNSSGINDTTSNDIQNSLIQGISTTTNGNIDGSTDPLFANASTGDFRLQATSPLIDKGSNTLYTANGGTLSTDKDLAGNPRLFEAIIDMGAYEYQIKPNSENILYVNTAVTGGDGSGNSWVNAIKELADALKWANTNKANFATTPLQILVAKGTYKPMYRPDTFAGPNTTDRNNSFLMVNNVQIYGGFDPANGIDDLTDTRIFGNNGSVLSGDIGVTSLVNDNVYHIVIGANVTRASLDGFVVRDAYAKDGNTISVFGKDVKLQWGAGIYNTASTIAYKNLHIRDNYAEWDGSAVLNEDGAKPTLLNILISKNTGFKGTVTNYSNAQLQIINSTISNNKADYGWSIWNNASSAKLYNSIIWGNTNSTGVTSSTDIENMNGGTITLKNSISQVYSTGNTTDQNLIATDPLFTNASGGDYSLQAGSPAIDNGNSIFYNANGGNLITDKDLAGNNRISECIIDMGAYEYQSSETYVHWDGSIWDNGTGPTQTLGACINNNYNLTNSFTTKNLKIINGSLNIKPNESVTVYGNITQSADNDIVLDNDANLIQINDNAVNSNHKINVKRSAAMRKMDYTYWGTPVSNQKLLNDTTLNDGFSVGTPNNRIYRYNEPNDYFAATTDSHFVPGKGYAIRGKDGFDENNLSSNVYLYNGNANNGIYSTSVQKSKNTILSGVEYEHGYNLIGNPYPSNIDFDKFFNLNTNSSKIFGKVWFWTNVAPRLNQSGSGYTGNNYATLNLTGGTPPTTTQPNSGLTPTQYIKVGQGFIVQVRDVATTTSPMFTHQLDFNNSIRTDEAGVFYNAKNNSSGKDRFWLQLVSPQQFTNTILVGYVNGATNQYDGDYDAEVMSLGDDSVYTLMGSQKLQIEGRQYPLSIEDIVLLGLKYAEDGIYELSLSTKEGIFNNNQTIYIKDKLLNKTVNISEEAYSFQAIKGTDENRFEIVYKPGNYLDTNSSLGQQLIVYKDKNEFVAKSSQSIKKIQLFDMSGRLWDEVSGNFTELRISHQSLVNGGYVLKIHSGNDIVTKKVIK